jgi:6-aminohexanoate-oligomer endohydrolase
MGHQIPLPFPDFLVACPMDQTMSTGATSFLFPKGARLVCDSRGGSVASVETDLLSPGSYSIQTDALVFAGGSTMGLAAIDGLRSELFRQRTAGLSAVSFDSIPSVPGAVVYDYSARAPGSELVYPDAGFGPRFLKEAVSNFPCGRVGAGRSTTAAKGPNLRPYFSGQGAAVVKRNGFTVFTALVLNPMGEIFIDGVAQGSWAKSGPPVVSRGPRSNTTLSLVLTDLPLTRNQLMRLAISAHGALAGFIRPFHTSYDGDVLFAGSLCTPSNSIGSFETKVSEEEVIFLAELSAEGFHMAARASVLAAQEE